MFFVDGLTRRSVLGGLATVSLLPIPGLLPVADDRRGSPEREADRDLHVILHRNEGEMLLCESGEPLCWGVA